MEDICDFVDGSGITECPDCGEIVEPEFDEETQMDKCPYCYNGKYMYGDAWKFAIFVKKISVKNF